LPEKRKQLTKPGELILVLSGKGHNGDDARVAAEVIQSQSGIAARDRSPKEPLESGPMLARKPALLIDGLFGIVKSPARPLLDKT